MDRNRGTGDWNRDRQVLRDKDRGTGTEVPGQEDRDRGTVTEGQGQGDRDRGAGTEVL